MMTRKRDFLPYLVSSNNFPPLVPSFLLLFDFIRSRLDLEPNALPSDA